MRCFVLFRQKTAYEMRISDWSSDVCSSDRPDRDGNFFSTVQKAAEHAAISGNSFLHLVFQRRKKKPYDAGTESQELKAEHERMETLMRRIDDGEKDAMMPPLESDYIWIEDTFQLTVPMWTNTCINS